MSDKLSELLPCPFCGCTKVPKRQGNGIGDYWLECFDCGASTRLREDGAGMEKDWNRRPSPAPATPAEPMPIDGWYVEVAANGERVLTISDEAICGLDELDPFAPVIRGAAAQLISFIGPGRDHVGNHVALSQSDPVMDALPDDEPAPAISESEDAPWVRVEDRMPEAQRTVIATYLNQYGKRRRIRAQYIPANTRESNGDDGDLECLYDEATDTFYWPAGWYECIDNWGDYTHVFVGDGQVTHWTDMPKAPVDAARDGGGS